MKFMQRQAEPPGSGSKLPPTEGRAMRERLVRRLVDQLEREGYASIAADAPDYDAPMPVHWKETREGCIPAAAAVRNGIGYLFDVTAPEAVGSADTARRWRLFDRHAREHGTTFIVVVHASCGEKARQQLEQLDIGAALWEIENPLP
jgi:hypothetical protein